MVGMANSSVTQPSCISVQVLQLSVVKVQDSIVRSLSFLTFSHPSRKKKMITALLTLGSHCGLNSSLSPRFILACRTGVIFCVFQANRSESEASAKRELLARGGALENVICDCTVLS